MFEVVFFFVSLFSLGLWLIAGEAYRNSRIRRRRRSLERQVALWAGVDIAVAIEWLGDPDEIIAGYAKHHLFVWKHSPLPGRNAPLFLVTAEVDGAGRILRGSVEQR